MQEEVCETVFLKQLKKIESLRGTHILKDANYKVCVFFEHENEQDMYMETLYTYLHTQNFKKLNQNILYIWEPIRSKYANVFLKLKHDIKLASFLLWTFHVSNLYNKSLFNHDSLLEDFVACLINF